jgi:hypothetical protein
MRWWMTADRRESKDWAPLAQTVPPLWAFAYYENLV